MTHWFFSPASSYNKFRTSLSVQDKMEGWLRWHRHRRKNEGGQNANDCKVVGINLTSSIPQIMSVTATLLSGARSAEIEDEEIHCEVATNLCCDIFCRVLIIEKEVKDRLRQQIPFFDDFMDLFTGGMSEGQLFEVSRVLSAVPELEGVVSNGTGIVNVHLHEALLELPLLAGTTLLVVVTAC